MSILLENRLIRIMQILKHNTNLKEIYKSEFGDRSQAALDKAFSRDVELLKMAGLIESKRFEYKPTQRLNKLWNLSSKKREIAIETYILTTCKLKKSGDFKRIGKEKLSALDEIMIDLRRTLKQSVNALCL